VKVNFPDLRAAQRSARRQASVRRVFSKYAFRGPLDQAVRWHLFYDGQKVISVVAQGKGAALSWSPGPPLEAAELGKPDRLQAQIKELSHGLKLSTRSQNSLGVVLHLADEIDVGIVQKEFENPELFEQARVQVRETPSEVVTDLKTAQDPSIQWRYYPLLSGQQAIVLRHRLEFLGALQTLSDLDIKVAVHSAPIEMLAVYLRLYAAAIEEKPHCIVLFYDRFTVIVPANQGVLDLKVLPHHQQDVPPAFGDDMFSLLEEFGLVESCVLLLIPCGTQEPTRLFRELDSYAGRNRKSADGIDIQIPDKESVWGQFDKLAPGQVKSEIIQRPEFLTDYHEGPGKQFPLSLGTKGDEERFGILSLETFWPDDQKSRDEQLPRSFAMAIVALRASRFVGLLCLLGLGGWLALSVYNASQGNVVPVLPEMISNQQAELSQLSATRLYLSQWDKILSPRSQAWSAMDFFLALLPEGKDVVCDRLRYAIKPATAGKGPGGFVREWIIEGSCTDQGRAHLERLREAAVIGQIFAATAVRLSEPSFALSDDRAIKAVLREESNPQFTAANATDVLPYQFRLVVTQIIEGSDPLAFPQLPKPLPKNSKPAG
jgi:hypothetical protein